MDFWEQKKIFFNAASWQKEDFSVSFMKLDGLKTEEENASALHKKTKKR